MRHPRASTVALALALALVPAGCANPAAKALTLEEDCPALRQMQTRRFDTQDEKMVLQGCAMLLQDLGFELDDSETDVGLLVASKSRTAVEPQQFIGVAIGTVILTTIALLAGGGGGDTTVPYDERQHMRVCLVTHPQSDGVRVRVTFQRIVWNNKGAVSKLESLQEPDHYEEFFERLQQAVFLEAHEP